MRLIGLAFAILLPTAVLAVGPEDTPPTPTDTTTACADGTIHDPEADACVPIEEARLGDELLYAAVRELAYAQRHEDALAVLARMSDQAEPRVLTYRGFVTRRMGDMEAGMAFYQAALATDPGFVLARSYMGQALIEQGHLTEARLQLSLIRDHGGIGSWAERSLAQAIDTGVTYDF